MRLIIKEKKLQEEKIGDKFYLYHATVTKPDFSNLHSFRNGVRADLSVGVAASQGKGFYVFQDYDDAYERLQFTSAEGGYFEFEPERDGYPMLVTIEVGDLDPTKFKIDNEVSAGHIIWAFLKYFNEFLKIKLPFPMKKSVKYSGSIDFQINKNKIKTISVASSGNEEEAKILSANCDAIEKVNPQLWHNILRELFEDAKAIKYVGKELIKPHMIEVMDGNGNMHDVSKKDPFQKRKKKTK